MSKWIIGKYIRLSLADRDLSRNDKKAESESVSHQKELPHNFIDTNPELRGSEQFEFFDDGYSGTNFDRPGFERLMEKIKAGEINCVIVKDFSRFGRDYIELGDYLERIFRSLVSGLFPSTTIMTAGTIRKDRRSGCCDEEYRLRLLQQRSVCEGFHGKESQDETGRVYRRSCAIWS